MDIISFGQIIKLVRMVMVMFIFIVCCESRGWGVKIDIVEAVAQWVRKFWYFFPIQIEIIFGNVAGHDDQWKPKSDIANINQIN